MKILVVNAGSSSLKWKLFLMPEEKVIISGSFDSFQTPNSYFNVIFEEKEYQIKMLFNNHEEAVIYLLKFLVKEKIINSLLEIKGIGNRVAHGGSLYSKPVIIDKKTENNISRLKKLAPIHNPINLKVHQLLKNSLPHAISVAVFDTSFHQTMELENFIYPIDYDYYKKYQIRKYGFHGTSFAYVMNSLKEKELITEKSKIIVCHLGSGSSLCAIKNFKSVNTTMGLGPLGGIMMSTRSGDLDPTVVKYLSDTLDLNISEVFDILNNKSGLFGVSKRSADFMVLSSEYYTDQLVKLSIDLFARKIANHIGQYLISLGGLDDIVFTGGIGQNSSLLRKLVIEKIKTVLDVELDEFANLKPYEKDTTISTKNSKVNIHVVKTNEELLIAKDTFSLIRSSEM